MIVFVHLANLHECTNVKGSYLPPATVAKRAVAATNKFGRCSSWASKITTAGRSLSFLAREKEREREREREREKG
jgi:hypothetical protein